jgi:hypothetical protein
MKSITPAKIEEWTHSDPVESFAIAERAQTKYCVQRDSSCELFDPAKLDAAYIQANARSAGSNCRNQAFLFWKVTLFTRAVSSFQPLRSGKPFAALVPIQHRLVRPPHRLPSVRGRQIGGRPTCVGTEVKSVRIDVRYVTGPGTAAELVVLKVILATIWLANLHFHWFK